MNKLLHVLVYIFLLLAGAGLFFEIQLNDKRTELTKRNRMQEDCFVKLAKTIEKAEPAKDAVFEIKRDNSPVEARLVDSPDMENILDDYPAPLEQRDLETYNWDNQRDALRRVFVLDFEGKPVMDGNEPQTRDSDEDKLLNALFESAKAQQTKLNNTRAALTDLRGKLEAVVAELNKLKPEARQDKVTIVEKNEKIAKLEQEKTDLENQITMLKSQIDDLNTEITSLKDEVAAAKDETEAAKEEVAKAKKTIDQLKEMLKSAIQNGGDKSASGGVAVTSLPAGDKGKIVEADNENMFAIVEFTDDTMKELEQLCQKDLVGVKHTSITVGGSSMFASSSDTHKGSITFTLYEEKERKPGYDNEKTAKDKLRKHFDHFPGATMAFGTNSNNAGSSGISIDIRSDDLNLVRESAEAVKKLLQEHLDIHSVQNDLQTLSFSSF